jgi:acetyl esterase/lipase
MSPRTVFEERAVKKGRAVFLEPAGRAVMTRMFLMAACGLWAGSSAWAAGPTVLQLWPGKPPGFQVESGPETDTSNAESRKVADRSVIRLGHVSTPQLHVFLPPPERRNGTAVVICPGGGFHILAWDLEGTEIAAWLNSQGITAAVLKYRVPTAGSDPNWLPPTQDAQRAISLVRSRAGEWKLDPRRIGILGFSAGGKTAAMAAVHAEKRLYDAVDEIDERPHRPDFQVLVYPAYLVDDAGELQKDVVVTKDSPPAFLVHAYDDRVTPKSSVELFLALKDAGVPAELHVFETGGHGYGSRPTDNPVTRWPERCEAWMQSRGLIPPSTAAVDNATTNDAATGDAMP